MQTLFWRLVSAPEGVRKGAAELTRVGALESEDLSFLVRPDARLGSTERLDVYADMYFYRLRDCLAEDFPKVAAWIGEARFHNLVTDYLLAQPPTHFSLRELGRALPDFLDAHALSGELPALADLARLEWARVDVFDDADATPLSREALLRSAAPPEELALVLIPSARLLSLDVSVLPLWKRLDAPGGRGADADGPHEGGEIRGVRVWRRGFEVFHRSLPADEECALASLASGGATLAELGELLVDCRPSGAAPDAARRLASLLDLWARDELLTRPH